MNVSDVELKITFCTVCMNRLEHLKETLPVNIRSNLNYPNVCHLLLDYNSRDGLESWIKKFFGEYIRSGRFVYFKTNEPDSFHRSHSRNMAFRLAEDGILCNIDADNFTGENFANYLNEFFLEHPGSFLSVDYRTGDKNSRDIYGRVACKKMDFLAVGGYDELMAGYGYEDIDFCERLAEYGLKQEFITKNEFLQSIEHTNTFRLANERDSNKIESVFVQYITPFKSMVIYLFQDHTFSMATIVDRHEGFGIPTLYEKGWIIGTWKVLGEQLIIEPDRNKTFNLRILNNCLLCFKRKKRYYRITDPQFRDELKMTYPILTNHQYFINNKKLGLTKVNQGKVGTGTVMRNFEEKIVLDRI